MGYYDQSIKKDLEQLEKLLSSKEILPDSNLPFLPLQQIIYGAPGTGKSFSVEESIKKYCMKEIRTTFHPDSDYSTFVGTYKPQMELVDVYGAHGVATGINTHDRLSCKLTFLHGKIWKHHTFL